RFLVVMPTDQYPEPPADLTPEIRTFARLAASLQEEAEAIGWYEQRLSVERDPQARAIMEDAQEEEFKHFAMALEFLSRRKPKWRAVLESVLFKEGDIVEHGERGEEAEKNARRRRADAGGDSRDWKDGRGDRKALGRIGTWGDAG